MTRGAEELNVSDCRLNSLRILWTKWRTVTYGFETTVSLNQVCDPQFPALVGDVTQALEMMAKVPASDRNNCRDKKRD